MAAARACDRRGALTLPDDTIIATSIDFTQRSYCNCLKQYQLFLYYPSEHKIFQGLDSLNRHASHRNAFASRLLSHCILFPVSVAKGPILGFRAHCTSTHQFYIANILLLSFALLSRLFLDFTMAILEAFPKASPASQAVFLGLSKKQWALTTVRLPCSISSYTHYSSIVCEQVLTCYNS